MINFSLTEEQELIKNSAKRFATEFLLPGVIDRDENGIFPFKAVKKMGELGFMGMMVPEEFGGSGLDTISYVLVLEEIASVEAATSTIMSVNNSLVCEILLRWGTNKQKEKYLPKLAQGIKLGAYSLSEPHSGSDAKNMKTIGKRKKDYYVVNGTKSWVTNGLNSDFVVIFCITDPNKGSKGVSAFIVDKDIEGLSIGEKEDKLGIRASDTTDLYFSNCKIPLENLLGNEGDGFKIAMSALGGGRIGIASQAVGIGRASLESAVKYSSQRKQFGKTINSFGAIQTKIADMATSIDAARLLVWRAASLKDSKKDFIKESSMAKLFASEIAMKASTDCVQIHGGYGYIREYGVERLMRDAKITQIYEGTSEIQRLLISKELMKAL
tara:strand:- start:8140 stop:9288 length:1149 start_codon:yes stop_codon:yes gene_type:complete